MNGCHRLLCYSMVVIFCIPLQAVLPSMSQYVVRRQCDELNVKRNRSYVTTASPLLAGELFGPPLSSPSTSSYSRGKGREREGEENYMYIDKQLLLLPLRSRLGNRLPSSGNSSYLPCDSPEVSASASLWLNWIWLSCNVPNMLTALALGTMSDVFGRRPLLLWCVGTQAAGSFGMAFVLFTHQPLWVFMPFFFINGVGGGCWVFVTLVTASLSDTTKDKVGRSHVFSVFMGLFYACGALGPLLGGQLTKYAGELFPPSETCTKWCHGGDLQTTFLLFFVTNVLLVLVAVFGFRESLPADVLARAKSQAQGKSMCWWALEPSLQPLRTIFSRIGRTSGLRILVFIYALMYVGFSDRNGLLTLFAQKEPFNMDPSKIGWFLFVPWMVRTLAVFALLPFLLYAARKVYTSFGYAEELAVFKAHLFAVRCGAFVATVFMATFGAAKNNLQLFALTSAGGMDALWDVACRVIFTDIAITIGVGSGEVLGIVGFLQTVLSVFAPLIFQSIYSESVNIYDGGFVFVVTAGITFIGFLLTWGLPAPSAGGKHSGGGGGGEGGDAVFSINAEGGGGARSGSGGGRSDDVSKEAGRGREGALSPPPSYLAGEGTLREARPLLQADNIYE